MATPLSIGLARDRVSRNRLRCVYQDLPPYISLKPDPYRKRMWWRCVNLVHGADNFVLLFHSLFSESISHTDGMKKFISVVFTRSPVGRLMVIGATMNDPVPYPAGVYHFKFPRIAIVLFSTNYNRYAFVGLGICMFHSLEYRSFRRQTTMKSFIRKHAITFGPLVELLFLKSLEAARQIFAECVIIFLSTHEAYFLAEIEVELDIKSNEGHALQLVRRLYRTILRYWSLFIRIFTVEWQCW